MWVNGITQGLMWRAVNEDGTLTYSFVSIRQRRGRGEAPVAAAVGGDLANRVAVAIANGWGRCEKERDAALARVAELERQQPVAWKYGVDDGNRTHDTRSHNPVLYQLSYAHHIPTTRTRTSSCAGAMTPAKTSSSRATTSPPGRPGIEQR